MFAMKPLELLTVKTTFTVFQTTSPYVVNGSVVGSRGTWIYVGPKVEAAPGIWYQTTLEITAPPTDAAQPLSSPLTASSQETVTWTGSSGQVFMYTIAILEVNYYPGGTITGVGNCNNSTCSGGYVANGYALCSGPTSDVSSAGGTIAYSQEDMGGAYGILFDHGIASYPEVQYNSQNNVWTFANPDSSQWTFGGVQCTGWSFSFPNP
jgi:hypothetical protein